MSTFNATIASPADTPGVVIVTVSADVHLCSATRLEHAVVAVIDGDVQSCILGLTGVGILDSSGTAALVKARHALDALGIALRTCTGERVHAVFELTGMVDYFGATPHRVEAFELIAQARRPSPTAG